MREVHEAPWGMARKAGVQGGSEERGSEKGVGMGEPTSLPSASLSHTTPPSTLESKALGGGPGG